jgi:tetratricopeptide (TPR) repeat protein
VRYLQILVLALGAALTAPAATSAAKPPVNSKAPTPATLADKEAEELRKIMEADDAAQEDIDKWIRDENDFSKKGAAEPGPGLRRRITERVEPVRKDYEDFLRRHPNNAKARLAYGSFLYDLNEDDAAQEQLERALEGNTNNPAIYNNLANLYAHSGPVEKAFDFYTRARDLKPEEPLYQQNLATAMYMFRKDAMEHYGLNEEQVFSRAMGLYSNALRLDPSNFPLASELAQTYYGIEPLRTNDALAAWTNALHVARDDIEREGVRIHLARVKILAGRFAEARAHLAGVTNEMYIPLKTRVARNLDEREKAANSPALPAPGPAPASNSPAPAGDLTAGKKG